jgi:glucosylceramidase
MEKGSLVKARRVRFVLAGASTLALVLAANAGWTNSAASVSAGASGPTLSWVMTTGDQKNLAKPQSSLRFGADKLVAGAVVVDESRTWQQHVGVGAAMTESSAYLFSRLSEARRTTALRDLFHPSEGAGLSLLRVPLGASDFALGDYTYDDVPAGQSDPELANFSIGRDRRYLIPMLGAAQAVNPELRLVLSAWSPPAWMKDSGTTHGGSLLQRYEPVYATYLARAAQAYTDAGFEVAAMTIVNEPNYATAAYPSTLMGVQQGVRVAQLLRAELNIRGLRGVGLVSHDHNWDDTASPITALTTSLPGTYIGSGFHCYSGDVSAQSAVVKAVPLAQIWTTECAGGTWSGGFAGDLRWGARNMLIGAFRHHSVASLWWNLALDSSGGPRNGGCQDCRGVVTVDPLSSMVTSNVEYWLLHHVGRYVPRGSVRIATPSRTANNFETVAFRTPAGKRVLLALNDGSSKQTLTVRWAGQAAQLSVPAGALITATW